MRTRSTPLLLTLLGLSLSLAGCGGSDGGGDTNNGGNSGGNNGGGGSSAPTITGATFKIVWPERSRAPIETGLTSAQSARIVFPKASSTGTDVTVNVDRDAAQPGGYTGTYNVPGAIRKDVGVFTASFFSEAAENGSTVGLAAGTIELGTTNLEIGTIVVSGTVRNLSVVPIDPIRVGDAPTQLYVKATNAQGTAVALSSGSIVWRIVSGDNRVSLTPSGLLTATASGTATFNASLDGLVAVGTVLVAPRLTTPQTQVLSLVANDLAYDAVSDRIWAAIPSGAAQYATNVVAINPSNGAVTKAIPVAGEPRKIAVTDDGHYAYVSIDGDGSIRRLDLITGTQTAAFSVGQGTAEYDLATMPGQPLTFLTASNPFFGTNIIIYDDGVARTGQGAGGSNVQVASQSTIYGEGNSSGSLFTNEVTSNSIRYTNQTDLDTRSLQYSDGLLYTSNGNIIDPATRTFVGTFPTGSLLVDRLAAVSSSDDRVYVNTWNPSTPKRIVVWDRSARNEITAYDTGFMPGGSENFIACGNHTVAFNAFGVSQKSIVIVRNLP